VQFGIASKYSVNNLPQFAQVPNFFATKSNFLHFQSFHKDNFLKSCHSQKNISFSVREEHPKKVSEEKRTPQLLL
jgi:hypothetical protein